MGRKGILIDYDYCCGCHTCEVACQRENGYESGVWGIKLSVIGPHRYEQYGGKVVYDIVPVPTDFCTLCEGRTENGELPTCVKHCQTGCMQYGDIADLAKLLEEKPKQVLFSR